MSIAHHHAEQLSLVPVSSPFLSLPVLMEASPEIRLVSVTVAFLVPEKLAGGA